MFFKLRKNWNVSLILILISIYCIGIDPVYADYQTPSIALQGQAETILVSNGMNGEPANGASSLASISANGRFVLFRSDASNLVPNDSNGFTDYFVYDLVARTTTRVSVTSTGEQGYGTPYAGCCDSAISADGQYVAFWYSLPVPGETPPAVDLYVHDLQSGLTSRILPGLNGTRANSGMYMLSLSGNGRYIAFGSMADNLVPTDTNGTSDVFVYDIQTGTTSRVSVDSNGMQSNYHSYKPSLSYDGRYITFEAEATNLVPFDANDLYNDIFLHDMQTGETTLVSVSSDEVQGDWISSYPSTSNDARYITFSSSSQNLVPGDVNYSIDVFVRDVKEGITQRISLNTGETGRSSVRPSISANGRFIAFCSFAAGLVPGDTNGEADIFVYDRQTGETKRASVSSTNAQADNESVLPSISINGHVAFESTATNLVPGDTNNVSDVFVRLNQYASTGIWYVDQSATGLDFGISWEDAFANLQSALSVASSGDEIWVATGTYKPTTGADRTVSFVLKNGVAIYGGFAGTETDRSQRNFNTNITILSGDIGIAGDVTDNSYHVVIGSNTNVTAVLDGFTVTAGNANDPNAGVAHKGGGIYNTSGSPTLTNLIISTNSAVWGGGMANDDHSDPILTNVTFSENVTQSQTTFPPSGGGIFNTSSSPLLMNVTFSGNSAEYGGGLFNQLNSSPILINATFSGNTASVGSGVITRDVGSQPILNHVTLSGNSAASGGGTIADAGGITIQNSIVWGNTGGSMVLAGPGIPQVSHSIIQGGYSGTGNIDADPLVGPLQDNGGFTQTMALLSGSPAIDAGNDSTCPQTDQRGLTRPQESHCDMGAYEARFYTISGNAGAPGVILSYTDTIYGTACVALPDGSQNCTTPLPVPAGKFHYVTSDQAGNYSFSRPEGWIGTVVPSKPGYTFLPVKRTYFDLSDDQLNQNYTLTPVVSDLPPAPGSTSRIVPADAVPTVDPINFELLSISGNGRYVAFVSNSPDLVPDDVNQRSDVFVWDRLTDATRRVSVNSVGEDANDHSFYPSLSRDGRYVAFESWATNLDTACIAGRNVYVHDMHTGKTICASVNAEGMMGNDISDRPVISADGRYVVYKSFATNLVSGDTNNQWDVFVFDIYNRTTIRVSVSSTGVQGNSYSENAAISGDGHYVAFWSNATNLVAGDTNASRDVFVRDTLANTTSRVSVSSSGVEGNGTSFYPSISEDGRYIAFASHSTNLVDGDTNGTTDVFVRDMQTQTTARVSLSSSNVQGNNLSTFPNISGNGRFVVFESKATNLVSNDTSVWTDIFMRDILTNKTSRVSVSSNGTQSDNHSALASLSADGRYVVFESNATNLAEPLTPNRYEDAFLHENGVVISGTVGIAGVMLSYTDGTVKTIPVDANGNYSFLVSYNWSGTVTPIKEGYSFVPASRSYTYVLMDQNGANYVAESIPTDTATATSTTTATHTLTPSPTFTPTYTPTATHVTITATFTSTPTPVVTPTKTKKPNRTPNPTKPPRRSIAVAPSSITSQIGSISGSLSSLSLIQQSEADDDASAYIRFQTPGTPYVGYRSYYLPADAQAANISSLLLQVNFKAPAPTQTWTWSLYDWTTGNWVKVGDTLGLKANQWNNEIFLVNNVARYVAVSGEIRVRLQSNDATDDIKLDYEALHITYEPVEPTPTAVVPTSIPTKPPYIFPATFTPTP